MGKRPSAIVLTDEEKASVFRTNMIRRRIETKRRNGAKAKQRT